MKDCEPIEIILGKEDLEWIDKIKKITGDTDDRKVIKRAINYVYEKDVLDKNKQAV